MWTVSICWWLVWTWRRSIECTDPCYPYISQGHHCAWKWETSTHSAINQFGDNKLFVKENCSYFLCTIHLTNRLLEPHLPTTFVCHFQVQCFCEHTPKNLISESSMFFSFFQNLKEICSFEFSTPKTHKISTV